MTITPGNTELIYINSQELHDVWSIVRDGLEVVENKISPEWITEDVYTAIRNNTSHLHVAYDDCEYDGFVVVTPTVDFDCRVLFVWVAYCPSGNAMERYWPHIREIAVKTGSRKVRFSSPREGFKKSSFN